MVFITLIEILTKYVNLDISYLINNFLDEKEQNYLDYNWLLIDDPVIYSVLQNKPDLLNWAYQNNYVLSSKASCYAAGSGNFERGAAG